MFLRITLIILLSNFTAHAHSGGTIKSGKLKGCHNDRKRSNFHCHKNSKLNERIFSSKEEAMASLNINESKHSTAIEYKRADWKHWIDTDGNCLNTRNEILKKRSLTKAVINDCKVISGSWRDYYFPEVLKDPSEIDIDHIIPLKEAHLSGGANWNSAKKSQFANDEENLVITRSSYNCSKGSQTIATWLPSAFNYACKYYRDWMKIKTKYGLSISKEEKIAIPVEKCP